MSDQSWELRDCFSEKVLGENVLTQGTVWPKPDGETDMMVWLENVKSLRTVKHSVW